MPRELAYIAVEGPHDIEFVARLLKPRGFARVRQLPTLDPYWADLVPKTYPPDDDLLKRVPIPLFFQSATHAVAIQSAIGVSNLVSLIQGTLDLKQNALPGALGIVLDADDGQSPQQRFSALVTELEAKGVFAAAQSPANMGGVTAGNPRWGIYVLPDNAAPGTLEDILLECADSAYPNLKQHAGTFVRDFDRGKLFGDDMDDFNTPAGPKKAQVACISSVLKPGKAIQVSIQDNRWLEGSTLTLPRVAALSNFLRQLLALP
jgi:hypothetical protein